MARRRREWLFIRVFNLLRLPRGSDPDRLRIHHKARMDYARLVREKRQEIEREYEQGEVWYDNMRQKHREIRRRAGTRPARSSSSLSGERLPALPLYRQLSEVLIRYGLDPGKVRRAEIWGGNWIELRFETLEAILRELRYLNRGRRPRKSGRADAMPPWWNEEVTEGLPDREAKSARQKKIKELLVSFEAGERRDWAAYWFDENGVYRSVAKGDSQPSWLLQPSRSGTWSDDFFREIRQRIAEEIRSFALRARWVRLNRCKACDAYFVIPHDEDLRDFCSVKCARKWKKKLETETGVDATRTRDRRSRDQRSRTIPH